MNQKQAYDLIKLENGSYRSYDGRFSIVVVLRKGRNNYWVLRDGQTGREEEFATKKACCEALRSRYPYWR